MIPLQLKKNHGDQKENHPKKRFSGNKRFKFLLSKIAKNPPKKEIFDESLHLTEYSSGLSDSSEREVSLILSEASSQSFSPEKVTRTQHPKAPRRTSKSNKGAKKSKALELYGPYPNSVPIPIVSEDGSVPTDKILDNAKSYLDLKGICDHRDKGTPDEWVPRDGRLIRLTGRHPLNCEPPMDLLKKFRFITPPNLNYVRSHGSCPQLTWEEHTLVVGGQVKIPLEIHMDDLLSLGKPREIPVTVTCAGNRRKEQNMIRQTIGFNWGPCATSTSVFKGILVRDVLKAAGVSEKNMEGMHVEFLGYEDLPNKVGPGPFKDEPWGETVKFGASVPLSRAMNKAFDIMIAYEQNGQRLHPDHGFPIRLVVPGYAAARNIKWLKEINIIPHETRNHYYYHDNRILPPHVLTMEDALKGDWFYKPEYVYNELNVNSVIASPGHGEQISLVDGIGQTYKISGYAYTGGGRHVTRVDISLDGGETWHIAKLDKKEKPTDYGMSWCWTWWDYEVTVQEFIDAREIRCRAWDSSNNRQPEEPIWSLMGYGNNHQYRVKKKILTTAKDITFEFQHPVEPGQIGGGWMEEKAELPVSAGFGKLAQTLPETIEKSKVPKRTSIKNEPQATVFTMEEIRKHDSEDDCWIVVHDRVYDCTSYLSMHPGGKDSILLYAGQDCTEDFDAVHSANATKLLENYYIGDVAQEVQHERKEESIEKKTSPVARETRLDKEESGQEIGSRIGPDGSIKKLTIQENQEERLVALEPKAKTRFRLEKKTVLSPDSFLLDFALPSPEHTSGIPTGKHAFIYAKVNGKTVMRAYTPISSSRKKGHLEFVIKAYRSCEKFPDGGIMSQHLDSVQVGECVEFRGPLGEIEYKSKGKFLFKDNLYKASCFNLLAGGTGITPCFQVAAEILRSSSDNTKVSLVYAAATKKDLLMKRKLDKWAKRYPSKFKVHYVLEKGRAESPLYSKGYMTKDTFSEHLYDPSPEVYNLMCGPPGMINHACVPFLTELGHSESQIIEF